MPPDDDIKRDDAGRFSATGGASATQAMKRWSALKTGAEQNEAATKKALKSYSDKKVLGGKKVGDVLKHLREEHQVDSEPTHGFSEASTEDVAKGMGIKPAQALKLLQKAAKAGHVSRRGHESAARSGKAIGNANRGFGFQIWELSNSKPVTGNEE